MAATTFKNFVTGWYYIIQLRLTCWDVLGVKYEAVAMKCLGTRALGGQGGQVSAVIRVRGGRGGRSHGSRMEHTPGHRSSDTASHCPLMDTELKTKIILISEQILFQNRHGLSQILVLRGG